VIILPVCFLYSTQAGLRQCDPYRAAVGEEFDVYSIRVAGGNGDNQCLINAMDLPFWSSGSAAWKSRYMDKETITDAQAVGKREEGLFSEISSLGFSHSAYLLFELSTAEAKARCLLNLSAGPKALLHPFPYLIFLFYSHRSHHPSGNAILCSMGEQQILRHDVHKRRAINILSWNSCIHELAAVGIYQMPKKY